MKLSINTGGGDAPGLNAVIGAVVRGTQLGWEGHGIRDGYEGLYEPGNYPDGSVARLTPAMVESVAHLGGTIFGTTASAIRGAAHSSTKASVPVDDLSVGDVGVSKVSATGNVYHLKQFADFPGTFAAASAGGVAGRSPTRRRCVWF